MAKRKLQGRPHGQNLLSLLRKHPEAVEVLERHGIHFCAGCYLTLASPLKRAAAYHAVPNVKRFLDDLRRFLD